MSPDENAMREWCCSLPLVGERELSASEREELKTVAQTNQRGCFAWGCGAPFLVAPFLALLAFLGEKAGEGVWSAPIGIAFALCVIIWPAITFLKANDAGGASKNARRDLKTNRVFLYGDEQNQIEVLGGSRLLWSANGERVRESIKAPPSFLAETPPSAQTAAQWAAPLQIEPEGHIEAGQFNRRDLTSAEKDEILQLARAWKRLFWFALILTLLFVGLPLGGWLFNLPVTWEPHAFVWLALTVWCDYHFIRSALFCSKLRGDGREGYVFLVRRPTNPEIEWDWAAEVVEILPASQAVWTLDGRPAPWRN